MPVKVIDENVAIEGIASLRMRFKSMYSFPLSIKLHDTIHRCWQNSPFHLRYNGDNGKQPLGLGGDNIKIASIGLGDIARKAYLPLLGTTPGIDLHLVTRNHQVLADVSAQYRIDQTRCFTDISDILGAGIEAAFVHVATNAHANTVRMLLDHNIHVCVDKPIAYDLETSQALVRLADEHHVTLMVGLNRRYAPLYRWLKEMSSPDIILMQKNRRFQPDTARSVVMDDFIHVIDTLRFLLPGEVSDIRVQSSTRDGLLQFVQVSLCAGDSVATGMMHRNAGFTEEQVEVIATGEKRVVRNISEPITYSNHGTITPSNDWQPTLEKRGFTAMVSTFLATIGAAPQGRDAANKRLAQSALDALQTHAICEEVIRQIEGSTPAYA